MKIGDMVFAEHHLGSFWVGLVIDINDSDPDFFQCRVLWNDGDETWEELDSILTPEQKEDLEEMADILCPG